MAVTVNPLDLTGKQVLVTGASSGIGRATAIMLSRLGASVIASGRRADALGETQAALDEPARHAVEPFDLAEVDQIPAWLKDVVSRRGAPLDGLVHSAGVGGAVPLRALGRRAMDAVAVPNMYAALALLRGGSAKGVAADRCSIVLLSSVAGMVGSPGLVAYSATKGAVQAMVKSAALELRARGMRVNAVAPGYVETPMMERSRSELPGFDAIEQRQFLGFPRPDEVATSVAYLLSDAATKITGTTIVIDGGFSC